MDLKLLEACLMLTRTHTNAMIILQRVRTRLNFARLNVHIDYVRGEIDEMGYYADLLRTYTAQAEKYLVSAERAIRKHPNHVPLAIAITETEFCMDLIRGPKLVEYENELNLLSMKVANLRPVLDNALE